MPAFRSCFFQTGCSVWQAPGNREGLCRWGYLQTGCRRRKHRPNFPWNPARKTTVKDSFKERIEKKLAKFDRFFDDATATVVVTNEKDRETVEITIQSMGMFFRAEKTTGDRIDSLESVTDSLMKQIIRNKSKLQKKFRSPAFVAPIFFNSPDRTLSNPNRQGAAILITLIRKDLYLPFSCRTNRNFG